LPGIHELLAEYASFATDTHHKGLLFERLIQKFLQTDKTYADKYDQVWLWQEWPDRRGKVDTGIDLVARDKFTGELCAIQCKFYDPHYNLQKSDIDSFFTASGKNGFTSRIIVSTTDKWSKHAEDALNNQQIVTTRIGVDDLANSEIDWPKYSLIDPDSIVTVEPKKLREHQIEALGDVVAGFDDSDRGKMIMACGTGKTFTSLRIAEKLVQPGGSVLFLVPSIALMSQTLKEWTAQSEHPIRAFAICSDTKVGKNHEDYSVSDLAFPATTKSAALVAEVNKGANPGGLTVYFSTYQSIQVIHEAQDAGLPEFDLIVCDEAHRTTGVTLKDDDESNFVRVHDAKFIRSARRLYMTATPKIYGDAVKAKAKDATAEIASMDDVAKFGTEFHRLSFGTAVERDLLTDYRVLVLAVSQEAVSAEFQQQFADGRNNELNIDDAARIVGIYKALAKSGVEDLGPWPGDQEPMRRAVAFSRSIKDSQTVSLRLNQNATIPANLQQGKDPLILESKHVDGTMNVLERNNLLDWLKADAPGNSTRILTNARCLSEGVDVPSLDAVIFLNSRDSQVDVVQSVGRVMRKAEGKSYGYIILPIAVPAGIEPDKALNDNAKYKVVWDVLRALRAHDERFDAKIQSFDLNRTKTDPQLQVIGVKDFNSSSEGEGTSQVTLDFTPLGDEWREAVYAKLVQKVGEREYWENWAASVADVAATQTLRIKDLVDTSPEVRAQFDRFVKGLQDNLNPSVTDQDALEMLAQHLITKPVLEALFEGFSFAENNAVAKAMEGMLTVLQGSNLETELEGLEGFYASVRMRVAQIKDPIGKQEFLKLLYQRFFAVAMKKASERLGIVYTPTEIVDFILRSVDHVLRTEFDSSISAEGVHILDPFTGTGTFIAQLLLSDLISDADLPRKYRHELHANEINLLAYYVAAVNIEEAYHSRMGGNYVPFDGILLTDTFQMYEADDELDSEGVFVENNQGVIDQMKAPINVIVGNPPYSGGQSNANDDNQNRPYPSLDQRIEETYARRSTAQNKNRLYDAYIRSFRWAADRLDTEGVIAFVSNGGFIDVTTADGMRKALVDEFTSLYIFNLRGNQRTSGDQSRREGGKVFGSGSRATIAVSILVKSEATSGQTNLYYAEAADYLSAPEKLIQLSTAESMANVEWESLRPNAEGDWIGQRSSETSTWSPLGTRTPISGGNAPNIFDTFSQGLGTSRDAWIYNSSKLQLAKNVKRTIDNYESERRLFWATGHPGGTAKVVKDVERAIDRDPTRISWSSSLIPQIARNRAITFDEHKIRSAEYRPFSKQAVYFDETLNHRVSQLPTIFPVLESKNFGFYVPGLGSTRPFCVFAVTGIPDLNFWGSEGGQFFPRFAFEAVVHDPDQLGGFDAEAGPNVRRDNITDAALERFRESPGASITKSDLFYYVYGILHSPEYRERYAADLKKMLPRIPKVKQFTEFAEAGRKLADLHVNYETVKGYPLEVSTGSTREEHLTNEQLRVTKMRFAGKRPNVDKSTIVYNDLITLSGIPAEAHEYLLGSRSAIEWILERYQIKTDKPSGIINDPNDWGLEHGNPRYILDLLKSIVTVSVETVKIVKSLPPLEVLEDQF
jgi:predicted helicase